MKNKSLALMAISTILFSISASALEYTFSIQQPEQIQGYPGMTTAGIAEWAVSLENQTLGNSTLWATFDPSTGLTPNNNIIATPPTFGLMAMNFFTEEGSSVSATIFNHSDPAQATMSLTSALPISLWTHPTDSPNDSDLQVTFDFNSSTWQAAVPEPATMAMFSVVFGMLGVFWHRKRR